MSNTMKYSDVNVESIVYNKTPKVHEKNEKHSYVGMFYPKREEENKYGKLTFFTPKLKCEVTDNYVHFFIPATKKKDPFFKFLLSVDKMNVHTASENSELWFGEELSDEDVQEKYKYSVKVGDMTQDGRVFSAKIKRNEDGLPMTKVYNETKDKCDVTTAHGKEVLGVVELERLVFSKHTYKAEWTIHQVKVYDEPNPPAPPVPPAPPAPPAPPQPEFEESYLNNDDDILDYDDSDEN